MSLAVEEYATIEKAQSAVPSASNQLTLEQANKLAKGRPFELINGRMVFKKDIFSWPAAAK